MSVLKQFELRTKENAQDVAQRFVEQIDNPHCWYTVEYKDGLFFLSKQPPKASSQSGADLHYYPNVIVDITQHTEDTSVVITFKTGYANKILLLFAYLFPLPMIFSFTELGIGMYFILILCTFYFRDEITQKSHLSQNAVIRDMLRYIYPATDTTELEEQLLYKTYLN
jgi:hypothetical protein